MLYNFFHFIYIFTTLFRFSFSGTHILQEFAQALVILEWHEIKIFNGINTILNTRNIYILVSFCSRYKLIIRHEYDQAYSTMESKKWTYRYSYHNWQEKTPYLKFDSSKSGYRRFSMLRSLSFTFSRFFLPNLISLRLPHNVKPYPNGDHTDILKLHSMCQEKYYVDTVDISRLIRSFHFPTKCTKCTISFIKLNYF